MTTPEASSRAASAAREEADGPLPVAPGASLLELEGIVKRFGAVQALGGVSLTVPAGQVTALVGDNGAGKSVTIKTISGIFAPDGGRILWQGRPVHIGHPNHAADLGITTVYQDLALCDNLDIVQNMFLGHERLRHRLLDEDEMERMAKEQLADLSVTTIRSIRQPVASLSGGQRQSVAVAKAVLAHSKLVILDEPTAALGVAQTEMVLSLVHRLSEQGVAVLMISHNLNDVFSVADNVAVLYLGHTVAEGPADQFDSQVVVDFMTMGRSSRDGSERVATKRRG